MELTGNLVSTSRDFISNKLLVTFSVNESSEFIKNYEDIKSYKLTDLVVKRHREKRSLDANAYFHVLLGKIAESLNISKPRCKNVLIGRYGQIDFLSEGEPVVIKTNIPVSQMLEQESLHVLPCGVEVQNGREINFYKVYRGSSTYNTKEMSVLIDGTVQEAKDLGIDTMTPDQLEKMKQEWKSHE